MAVRVSLLFIILSFGVIPTGLAQCVVNITSGLDSIVCGECIMLSASGNGIGSVITDVDFNSGSLPLGWTSSVFRSDNPCSPSGVDGTKHVWFGNNSAVPRFLNTTVFNLSSAGTAGAQICFDLLFAEQGNVSIDSTCEGPDEPDEGVYLQFSVNGGQLWTTIHYFDPLGGLDPQLTNWTNWCFPIPQAATSSNTTFRFFQDNDSGADYDHWGIDNVTINTVDSTYNMVWLHDGYSYGMGNYNGTNPTPVCPRRDTSFIISMTKGALGCADTVSVKVGNPVIQSDLVDQMFLCAGNCDTISASTKVITDFGGLSTFTSDTARVVNPLIGNPDSIPITISGLNNNTLLPGAIQSVCLDAFTLVGFIFPAPIIVGPGDVSLSLICPEGNKIMLVPAAVTFPGGSPFPTGGYSGTCFSINATDSISNGAAPYTGSFIPEESFNNLAGCSANGVWYLEVALGPHITGQLFTGSGSVTFSIKLMEPEVSYQPTFVWNPVTHMTGANTLIPVVCPPQDQTYRLTLSDSAGCVSITDSVSIMINNDPSCQRVISGRLFTEGRTPIAGAKVALTGDDTQTDSTDSAGRYSFTVAGGGSYNIIPSKTNDVVTNNGISTIDILQTRRHILNTLPLSSPFKIIAADVDSSNSVSTLDILLMRSMILQNINTFPNGRLWSFVPDDYVFANPLNPFPYPSSRTYTNLQQSSTNQNFIGIKLGDVNGSWDGNIP